MKYILCVCKYVCIVVSKRTSDLGLSMASSLTNSIQQERFEYTYTSIGCISKIQKRTTVIDA